MAGHYSGNKGSLYSGFYFPLSCIALVYFSCGVAAQGHQADTACLHGVVVTLSPVTHKTPSAYSDSRTVKKEKIAALCRTTAPNTLFQALVFSPFPATGNSKIEGLAL